MTDPERISRRGRGLAAELLQASADEQPSDIGMQRTLAALGVSGAILGATSLAGAATAPVASGGKTVTALLLAKWIGVGIMGGVGLASAAAVVATPSTEPPAPVAATASVAPARARVAPSVSASRPVEIVAPPAASSTTAPRSVVTAASAPASLPEAEPAELLAAEVAFVDRARADLAAGKTEQGLSALSRYEREYPDARLLPEVLFLQLEAYERLGRDSDARRAAQRLVNGFPRSPHAARARQLLNPQPHFP
jgi:hypothetical protein